MTLPTGSMKRLPGHSSHCKQKDRSDQPDALFERAVNQLEARRLDREIERINRRATVRERC